MMTSQDGYKLFNKVLKRWEKNRKKYSNGMEDDNMSDVDEVGLTDNINSDNEKDSDEESVDEEIESVDATEAENELIELDAQNQLYVLEMILSFHAWYKCGSPYFLGSEQ